MFCSAKFYKFHKKNMNKNTKQNAIKMYNLPMVATLHECDYYLEVQRFVIGL